MLSGIKRDELKEKAIALRQQGDSFPMIEAKLGVRRSTLSGWLCNLKLSPRAEKIILTRKKDTIRAARVLAAQAHRGAREARKKVVEEKVRLEFSSLPFTSIVKEALLTMLYLGEGFKRRAEIGLGNSNPLILFAFVKLVREIYHVPISRLRCAVFLRADQDSDTEKMFWSKTLGIPLNQFHKTQFDKRTIGKETWGGYHGVCSVRCYDASIAKRLTAWQEILLEKIITGL